MELLHRLQLFTQGNQVGFAISVWCVSSNNFSLKQIASFKWKIYLSIGLLIAFWLFYLFKVP